MPLPHAPGLFFGEAAGPGPGPTELPVWTFDNNPLDNTTHVYRDFDGTEGPLNVDANKATISAWVKTSVYGYWIFFSSETTDLLHGHEIGMNGSGYWAVLSKNGGDAEGSGSAYPSTNIWYSVTVWLEVGAKPRLWANGTEHTAALSAATTVLSDMPCRDNHRVAWGAAAGAGNAAWRPFIYDAHVIQGVHVAHTAFYSGGLANLYTGPWNNRGVYQRFENAAGLGDDSSGNLLHFTGSSGNPAQQQADLPPGAPTP